MKKSKHPICNIPKSSDMAKSSRVADGDVFIVEGKCMNYFGDLIDCDRGKETTFIARLVEG